MIRAANHSDLAEIERLHSRYFASELELPDFMNFVCAFVVEDEKGLITSGGICDIAECIAVTNMEREPKVRAAGLYQLLDASKFVCRKSGYDRMHIWTHDPRYTRRLVKNGFRYPYGQSLILDL